jgi:hypothetical protein
METIYDNFPDREHIAGISNYNSSCWLNSSLQALIACPSLEKLFLNNPFTINMDITRPKIITHELFSKLQDLSESICTYELMKTDEYMSDKQDKYNHIIYPFQFIASPELCLDFFSVFKTIYYSEGVVDILNFYNTYFTRFKLAKSNNWINQSLEDKFTIGGFNDAADFLQYLFTNLFFFEIITKDYNPYKYESVINEELLENLKLDGMNNIFIVLQLGENPEYTEDNILKKNMQQYLTEQESQLKDLEDLEDTIFIKLEINRVKKSFLKPNYIIDIKGKQYILCSVIVFVGEGHYRVVTRKYRADDNRIDLGTKPILDFCNNGYDYIHDDNDRCPGYIYVYDSYENYTNELTEYSEFTKKIHQDWNIKNVLSLKNLLESKKGTTIYFDFDNFIQSPISEYWQGIKKQLLNVFEEIEIKKNILKYFQKNESISSAKSLFASSSAQERIVPPKNEFEPRGNEFEPRGNDLQLDDGIPVYFKRFTLAELNNESFSLHQKFGTFVKGKRAEGTQNAFDFIKFNKSSPTLKAIIVEFLKLYNSESALTREREPGGAAARFESSRFREPRSDNSWDTTLKRQKEEIQKIAGDNISSINFNLSPQEILESLLENQYLQTYQKDAIADLLISTMTGGSSFAKYKKYLKYKNKYLQIKRLEK